MKINRRPRKYEMGTHIHIAWDKMAGKGCVSLFVTIIAKYNTTIEPFEICMCIDRHMKNEKWKEKSIATINIYHFIFAIFECVLIFEVLKEGIRGKKRMAIMDHVHLLCFGCAKFPFWRKSLKPYMRIYILCRTNLYPTQLNAELGNICGIS